MRGVISGLAVAVALATCPVGEACAEERTIQLDDDETAHIATDEDKGTLTVTVSQSGWLTQSVTIGNASFTPEDVAPVVLCSGCEPSYFIKAWDRSSTYGAATGLVLWQGGWWNVAILPLAVADLSEPNADGVSTIIDLGPGGAEAREYRFRDGFLIERNRIEPIRLEAEEFEIRELPL